MAAFTPKMQRFVEEYVTDWNAKRAATAAGYSAKTAHAMGNKLLKLPHVKAAVEKQRTRLAEKCEISVERVLREIALAGFANMQDYMRVGPDGDPVLDFSALSRDQAAALAEVTVDRYTEGRGEDAREIKRVKFKLASKLDALDKLCRHLGLFKDRLEHVGRDGGPIEVTRIELVPVAPGSGK